MAETQWQSEQEEEAEKMRVVEVSRLGLISRKKMSERHVL